MATYNIIGDIHGRDAWKRLKEMTKTGRKIIRL